MDVEYQSPSPKKPKTSWRKVAVLLIIPLAIVAAYFFGLVFLLHGQMVR